MASRTCPHCNHQYSIKNHFAIISTFRAIKSWNCSNCNALIRVNTKWGMILSIIFGMSLVTFNRFNNQCGISLFYLSLLLLFFIIIHYIIHIFDKYELVQ